MPRPIAADAEATKARILETAAHLFAKYSVGSTTMRQIAREAEVSQSVIHHYFGSKSHLYESCINAMYESLTRLEQELFLSLDPTVQPHRMLEVAIIRAMDFARNQRPNVLLMTRSVLDQGEQAHPLRIIHLERLLERGVALLDTVSELSQAELRFALYSFTFIGIRLALVTDTELKRVLNVDLSGEALYQAADLHLVSLAHRHLGVLS